MYHLLCILHSSHKLFLFIFLSVAEINKRRTKDKINQACLDYACREGKMKVCEFLIKQCNLPLNERDIYGQEPIYYATREGKVDTCKLLVDNGADVNIEDLYGQNCLFYAVKRRHFEVVKFLVDHGINVNVIDKMNMTVLSLSEKIKTERSKSFCCKMEALRM